MYFSLGGTYEQFNWWLRLTTGASNPMLGKRWLKAWLLLRRLWQILSLQGLELQAHGEDET
jgi:hypothetical protein